MKIVNFNWKGASPPLIKHKFVAHCHSAMETTPWNWSNICCFALAIMMKTTWTLPPHGHCYVETITWKPSDMDFFDVVKCKYLLENMFSTLKKNLIFFDTNGKCFEFSFLFSFTYSWNNIPSYQYMFNGSNNEVVQG
jgi:hypothetical protein